MKHFLTILFLFVTSVLYGQQNIHICYDTQTSFTYMSMASEPGILTWYVDSVQYGEGNSIMIDWNQYSLGTHIIMVEFASITGCPTDPEIYYVTVLGCDEFDIYIPNAFSPNNNGKNDTWFPIAHNYSNLLIWIYDRWGTNLFFSHGESWNGTYKEAPCKVGVYVYVIVAIDLYGGIHRFKGNITLIR